MSEQKNISPLLDGFTMGNPMSDHDGVRCCPAIKENSENKYIVKVITVPASQVQIDALLLAGAFKDPSGVMDYYKNQAEELAAEAELLKKLSSQEGFLPYDGWQIEPITRRRLGYEVYLISSYKRSLERHLHRNPVTHLEAFNMAMDICDALSVCRDTGYLYVDLKPSNIFMSEQKEYRIGDLGFLALDALHYTTLPDKYRSAYTPPECEDPMAPLGKTVDTYALGMILYQLYNDSQLPSAEDVHNGSVPSPVNADYELAEIIMTAIHADPDQRWQEPSALRQALVAYMQRNVVNDVPITLHTPLETANEDSEAGKEEADEAAAEEEIAVKQDSAEDETSADMEDTSDSVEPLPDADHNPATAPVNTHSSEENTDTLLPHEMSEELSKIVTKADDLIAHEVPEEIVIPAPAAAPDPFAFASEDSDEIDDADVPLDPLMDEASDIPVKTEKKKKKSQRFVSPERKRRTRRFLTTILFLAAMAAVGLCGYLYYQLFYLIPVNNLIIQGTHQQITVTFETEADASRILAKCTDPYGNIHKSIISNGSASFTGLMPDTLYKVHLEIDGFHKLSGETSAELKTDANSNIVSFTAENGPEDGSFILNFTVEGEEPDEWTVVWSAEGEKEQSQTFTGHTVSVRNLTVGKLYTFTLQAGDGLTLSGNTTLECIASRLIVAKDLTVSSENGNDMTIHWKTPGDVVVRSWNVRCYNNQGFDVQLTTEETQARISEINLAAGYTIEVTASGMTQPARISITKEPIVIDSFVIAQEEDPAQENLEITWTYSGTKPKDGWLLLYTVDGSATPIVVTCKEPSAVISPRIPGARYQFSIQSANGTSVINSAHTYEAPEGTPLDLHSLTADMVTTQLLKTPASKNWQYESINDSEFTDVFSVGDPISVVFRVESPFYLPGNKTYILYFITDSHGIAIPDLTAQEHVTWKSIWLGGDAKTGELDVPVTPDSPGNYILNIYMNGMSMAQVPFTVQ